MQLVMVQQLVVDILTLHLVLGQQLVVDIKTLHRVIIHGQEEEMLALDQTMEHLLGLTAQQQHLWIFLMQPTNLLLKHPAV